MGNLKVLPTPMGLHSPLTFNAKALSRESLETPSTVEHKWKPAKPQLTHPSAITMSEYRLLSVTDETRTLGNEILECLSTRLDGIKTQTKELSEQIIGKLKEAAERASSSDLWSMLKKIATSLLSAISIVFGGAVLAMGGSALTGGAMIASGVLSLSNFALSEMGIWDTFADWIAHDNEEEKKKIALIMPACIGIIAGGIGLMGSAEAIAKGAFGFAEKAALVAQGALTLFEGVTTLGKGIADTRRTWTEAELITLHAQESIYRDHFTSLGQEIQDSMSEFKSVKSQIRTAIQSATKVRV
jgi:hypothetical protein